MLTKSVKSVISVGAKARCVSEKKSVQSVRSVSHSNILLSGKTPKEKAAFRRFIKQRTSFITDGVLFSAQCAGVLP